MDSGASWAIYSLFIVYATPYSLWGCKRVGHDLVTTATAKSLQSCPTLCHPIDSSPPGSPVPGILQARTLEWVAISFSKAWKWNVKVKSLSRVWLFSTPWTTTCQAPPSTGFSRQEYWSGVPLPSPQKRITRYYNRILCKDHKEMGRRLPLRKRRDINIKWGERIWGRGEKLMPL